jgi:hypothetical protein
MRAEDCSAYGIASEGERIMDVHEFVALRMAKDRMDEAARFAERRRALSLARGPRRPMRVQLGAALIRIGYWLMGDQPCDASRMFGGFERGRC